MVEKVILAGFGGQGVMSIGQMLTYAGMMESKQVSWLPSYGPEMRGGTANCNVIVSDDIVASPIVTKATAVLALNLPSLDKFEDTVMESGNLIINSSLVERKTKRDDVHVFYVPANKIADDLGNSRIANMVMLGAYLELTKVVKVDSVLEALKKVLGASKEKFIPINREALELGAKCIKDAIN